MARELRFYSLVLIFVFMLWSTPGRGMCPYAGIYHGGYPGEANWFYIEGGSPADLDEEEWQNDYDGVWDECSIDMPAGTYYDRNNFKWVLNTALYCAGGNEFYGNSSYIIGMNSWY